MRSMHATKSSATINYNYRASVIVISEACSVLLGAYTL